MTGSGDADMDKSLVSRSKISHVLQKPTVANEGACGRQYTTDYNVSY